MASAARSVAAALAVIPSRDDAPRVIRQFASIFLVSRYGQLWRVYDSSVSDGTNRRMPSPESTLPFRIFVALARKTELRAHTFAPGDAPDTDPVSLQRQLDESTRM